MSVIATMVDECLTDVGVDYTGENVGDGFATDVLTPMITKSIELKREVQNDTN